MSTNKDTGDEALRERLLAEFGDEMPRGYMDRFLAFVGREVRRAKGYPENPCTGAEFLAAMQAAGDPMSEECYREVIEELQDGGELSRTGGELAQKYAQVVIDRDEAYRQLAAVEAARAKDAAELERLRCLERSVRVATHDSSALDELDTRVLAALEEFDRAPTPPIPQAEPQPSGEGTGE